MITVANNAREVMKKSSFNTKQIRSQYEYKSLMTNMLKENNQYSCYTRTTNIKLK